MLRTYDMKLTHPWNVLFFFFLFLRLLVSASDFESNIIGALPGYPDPLPFKLETGYIGIGENEALQLFYYFVESERDPGKDPVLFWITGGPGCSGFSGLVLDIGPLKFDVSSSNGSLPSFKLNPYSWTKIANIIFIDSPVGTGFSYANTPEAYHSSDTRSSTDNYMFLRKWLLNHPTFIKNRMYIGGDSYGGKIVPMIALEIARGNKAGLEPWIPLQGYVVGNSITDLDKDSNERIPYAHRMALISDEYYEFAKISCEGEYVNPNPNNAQCLYALALIKECTKDIVLGHILYPKCDLPPPETRRVTIRARAILVDDQDDDLYLYHPYKKLNPLCKDDELNSNVWANDQNVQRALHIRKMDRKYYERPSWKEVHSTMAQETIKEWIRCNGSIFLAAKNGSYGSYVSDVRNILPYHRILNEEGYQILAYSGDHDMVVPHTSTLKWIREINLTVNEDWRPWTVNRQVAGYTMKFKKNEGYITFATIKGAGHIAPDTTPKECFAMVNRWLSLYPL